MQLDGVHKRSDSTSQQSNESVSRENINSKQVKYQMSAAAENDPFLSKVEVCKATIQQLIQDSTVVILYENYLQEKKRCYIIQ